MAKRVRITLKKSKGTTNTSQAKAERARVGKPKQTVSPAKTERIRIGIQKQTAPVLREGAKESESDKRDYPVGYGKPPVDGQMKKGYDPRRTGRRPGSKNLTTVLAELAQNKVAAIVGGKKRKVTMTQAITIRLAANALAGNNKAISEYLDWMDKVETRAEAARPSEYPVSDADLAIIKEVHGRLMQYKEREQ